MNTADIIIPTFRTREQMAPMVCDVEGYVSKGFRLITTCSAGSAAFNRNIGLKQATADYVIMIDDDMRGFFPDWDQLLIEPLISEPDIIMVGARLMLPGGLEPAFMMGDLDYNLKERLVEARQRKVPTAACAFRRDPMMKFDERFIKSGFEDTWFMEQLNRKHPHGRHVINNSVKLIHLNEKKGQDEAWAANEATFTKLMKGELV
jgi:glycosyltransferase involved in cell wall biosynthesis